MLKRLEIRLLFWAGILFSVLCVAAYCRSTEHYFAMAGALFVSFLIIRKIYKHQKKTGDAFDQFVDAVRYRDFSRHFDEKHVSPEFRSLHKGFNQINASFRNLSKERETSHQYLQKILELVGTGILSFDIASGETIWMNESLKKMLMIPYLQHIQFLKNRNEQLYHEMTNLNPGNTKVILVDNKEHSFKVLMTATAFQTSGKKFKLIAFQNISEVLDETESKAWTKLLSVMTHEIMNSIAPISSLAGTLKKRLESPSQDEIEDREMLLKDLGIGIDTIKKRSESLLRFAETYRNLSKINKPNLRQVYIRDLFENLYQLMEPTLGQKEIEMEIILKDTELKAELDQDLIEQALINLVLNAIEALKDKKEDAQIILYGALNYKGNVVLKVSDNGKGIPADIRESIFIPFFSTRKNGNGIGLSLCKQIMLLHNGTIEVKSVPDKGTAFTLQFP